MTIQKFNLFRKGLDKQINKTFSLLLEKARVEEQDIINKHLKVYLEELEDTDRQSNREIKVSFERVHTRNDLLKFCILSWYLPEITRYYFQDELRETIEKTNFYEFKIYLESNELCLFTLYRENHVSHISLFGNILNDKITKRINLPQGKTVRVKKKFFIKLVLSEKSVPKKKTFKRGYDDHGSLAPQSRSIERKELSMDLNNQNLQEEIERKRIEKQINYAFLKYKLLYKLQGMKT